MKILGTNQGAYNSETLIVAISRDELRELSGFYQQFYAKREENFTIGKEYKLDGIFREAQKALELASCADKAANELIRVANDFKFFFGPEPVKGAIYDL